MAASRTLVLASLLSAAAIALADASISDVVVNQRWPWNEKVDVDFILSGETADVYVTARWDGHPEPCILGTAFSCTPGSHRFTWDPAASEFAGQTLTGFTVSLSNALASTRPYLVVDLENGGHEFLPGVPSDGWTAAHKSSKMVFRRIPAGTYTLGEPVETFDHLDHYDPGSVGTTNCNRRTVTFTGDFYVGIYKYTEAQHAYLASETPSTSYVPKLISYNALRGEKSGDDSLSVDWPAKGYRVAADSIVAKLRAKAGAGLVADLCEEEQWEVAARANTITFWPTGGTMSETLTTHTNQVNQFVAWYGNTGSSAQKEVGTKADNGWGLYDVSGLAGEWTLDTARNYGTSTPLLGLPATSVDPTGAQDWNLRIIKGASGNGSRTGLWELLPCRRQMADPSSTSYTTRFCIHLKPLGSLSFD